MLQNSSSTKLDRSLAVKVGSVVGYSAWVMGAVFIVPALLLLAIYWLLKVNGVDVDSIISNGGAVSVLVLYAAQFIIGFGVMVLLPRVIQKLSWSEIQKLVGLARWPKVSDVGLALLGFVAYMVMTGVVQALMSQYLPGYIMDQPQDVGFASGIGGIELVLAGVALVLLAPVFEELIFRGYLFGSLRAHIPFWLTAVVVSVLFGVAHGQLNVAADVFVLSMVMSTLRERTGTIYPTILMHMTKNGLAFYLLFINPELIKSVM